VTRDVERLELLTERVVLTHLEQRFDLRLFGSGADVFGFALAAEHELERSDENAFPRTGLAGDHVQARAELHLKLVDDGEISDLNAGEHGQIRKVLLMRALVKYSVVPALTFSVRPAHGLGVGGAP